jgi:hypothetical protein
VRIAIEAPAEGSDLFQQVLLVPNDVLLFWTVMVIIGLLSLNRIIVDVKAMVDEIQGNPDTHIPGLRPWFLRSRR